jgi:FkbM family methyltransferase
MGILKNTLLKFFPARVVLKLYAFREVVSAKRTFYSLEGEDIVLNNIFNNQAKGFYIDIGANHPKMHSNTYLFYKKGWRGINVDAAPGSMNMFNIFRSRDINIEKPVSDKIEKLKYYMFDQSRVNSFSESLAKERTETTPYKIIDIVEIETSTLKKILDEHLPENTVIDFISIDVEGYDFNVLLSNDWEKYIPRVIVIEELESVDKGSSPSIYGFLTSKGYNLIAKTGNSCIYCLRSDLELGKYLACKLAI